MINGSHGRCGSTPRILVIDDDPALRVLIRRILEFDGYEVVVADDGLRGFAAAQHQRPDAIVLDLMMPVMDGYEVLGNLRDDPATSGVPVIVLTAAATMNTRERVLEAGAAAYLTKPFGADELSAAVAEARVSGATRERQAHRSPDRAFRA